MKTSNRYLSSRIFCAACAMSMALQLLPACLWAQENRSIQNVSSAGGPAENQQKPGKSTPELASGPAPAAGRTAFVSVAKALIYSGPAEEFYPTHQLPQGTAVQVFHQTESGWVAIRPPKGSFSWIPASEVFLLPGGKSAEVTTNNSVSWIGTALGTANQYRWQVRLHKSEQLMILGEEVVKDSEGRESLWYKISPPNGEFRWIQSGFLSSEPPAVLARQTGTPGQSAEETDSASDSRSNKPDKGERPARLSDESEVQPAGYDGIIVHESDGEVVWEGDVVEGGVYYDEPHFDEGYYIEPEWNEEPDASWNDWQLFEFTDDGLRFPLWERALNKRAQLHDPLVEDPFSLAMAPKAKGPRVRSVMHEEPARPDRHRRTPWRDPRMLAQQRMQGFPQASTQRGSGSTLSALRGAFSQSDGDRLGELPYPVERNSIQPNAQAPSSDYYRDMNQPRPAPSLDQSTGIFGNNFGMENSGNWLSRNWFGLQQQFSDAGSNIAQTSNSALMQLQLRLNEIVTQPMVQWNFGNLKNQVQQLIQSGPSPVERGQARLLMERIEAFEQLAVRSGYHLASYSDVPSGVIHASFSQSHGVPAQLPSPAVAVNHASHTPFEATGWMVPVHSATSGQPSHAITDDSGRIVAYVTGLPGMNLDRYINQSVGIQGLRGYLPQLQAAHIEAQNVVRIR